MAETLITLVIIGVVAALTVPTLIVKYQKEETVTRLKKVYTTISQTTQKAIADNGPIRTWELSEQGSKERAHEFFIKYLKPYLNVAKDCGVEATDECDINCIYLNKDLASFSYSSNHSGFYLQDGTLVSIWVGNSTFGQANLYIDINGKKGPNQFGRDIFLFIYYIQNSNDSLIGKIVPFGLQYGLNSSLTCTDYGCCNKNATSSAGYRCAAVIMKSGWTIPDNYPW